MRVTAAMPTWNRSKYVPGAIACFLSQTYADKELLILDDGTEPIRHLVPERPDIRYVRIEGKRSTGEKRNLCGEHAQGEIIVHWDDDDWSAPERIQSQVKFLLESGKQMVGYHSLIYYLEDSKTALRFRAVKPYACGTSQCYYRSFWQKRRFRNVSIGEDSHFSFDAMLAGQLASEDGEGMMVARTHSANTCTPSFTKEWESVPLASLPCAHYHIG